MKKTILLALLFTTTLSVSGISSAFGLADALKQPTFKTKKDAEKTVEVKKSRAVEALELTISEWVNAFNDKDIEKLMAFYDEESVFATSTSELIQGSDNIKAWYQAYLSEITGSLNYQAESITEKGGVGTLVVKFSLANEDETKPAITGRAMLIFKKKFLGDWLLLSSMVHLTSEN